MENTKNLENEELNKIKGHFMKKYGVSVDKFSAMVLQEMAEGFDKLKVEANAHVEEIKLASSRIHGSVRNITFTNKTSAFYFALGHAIPFSLVLFAAIFLCYSSFIYMIRHHYSQVEKQKSEVKKEVRKTEKSTPKPTKRH